MATCGWPQRAGLRSSWFDYPILRWYRERGGDSEPLGTPHSRRSFARRHCESCWEAWLCGAPETEAVTLNDQGLSLTPLPQLCPKDSVRHPLGTLEREHLHLPLLHHLQMFSVRALCSESRPPGAGLSFSRDSARAAPRREAIFESAHRHFAFRETEPL